MDNKIAFGLALQGWYETIQPGGLPQEFNQEVLGFIDLYHSGERVSEKKVLQIKNALVQSAKRYFNPIYCKETNKSGAFSSKGSHLIQMIFYSRSEKLFF